MKRSSTFTSWLASYFEDFVALRKAGGALFKMQRFDLLRFDHYVVEQATPAPLLRQNIWSFLASIEHLSASTRDHIVGVVWAALSYAKSHGAEVEALPERPSRLAQPWLQRLPRILTEAEITRLMAAARRVTRAGSLRSATITTLIGLLATTGLRIREALGLDVGDLGQRDRILTIRRGKFGKTRVLPLRDSTTQALVSYIAHSQRSKPVGASTPLFVSSRGRLGYETARGALRGVCLAAEIPEPWPQPRDFRHTFAVRRVADWYEQGRDVDMMLPALSTYLGHVSVENTRHYLVVNGLLLEQAAHRFEEHTHALDEVLP